MTTSQFAYEECGPEMLRVVAASGKSGETIVRRNPKLEALFAQFERFAPELSTPFAGKVLDALQGAYARYKATGDPTPHVIALEQPDPLVREAVVSLLRAGCNVWLNYENGLTHSGLWTFSVIGPSIVVQPANWIIRTWDEVL